MIHRRIAFGALVAAGLLVAFAGGARAQPPAPVPSPIASPLPSPSPPPTGGVTPHPAGFPFVAPTPAAYANFIKKASRQVGLIDLLRKDDDIYFDLRGDQLGKRFIVAPVVAAGFGEAFAGRVFEPFIVEFQRVGKRILWVTPNPYFSAPPNSAAGAALRISVPDSVIASSPIVAEDEFKQRLVISASFFLTDFLGIGQTIAPTEHGPFGLLIRKAYSIDGSKSYVERTKALLANDEILASLAFNGPPANAAEGAAPGSVRVKVHYSIIALPPPDAYRPRLADDRVGYFVTAHKDFSDDALPSPIVRYIDRRDLANGPIVYYLTDEIPVQYRPVVRAAILEWNRAFAKIGIPHAIEVRDQPHEPNWDPDDIRYNTVRWITSDRENFAAYGPFIVNPLTGEIIRSELVIDGEALRSIKRGYVDTIVPALQTSVNSSAGEGAYRFESAQLAAAGSLALRIGGAPRSRIDRYADDWLRATVLHEVGHTFGLRHNFAGSALYSPAELRNPQFTARHGISSSVMDYLPANLMPPGTDHETFFQTGLGPYDLWAIRYGYERFPKARSITAERAQLDEIADLSVRPEYRYGTDDDAFGADGFDPRIAPFDLSNDPLTFDAGQFAIARDLAARLDRTYPTTGEPYDRERAAFIAILTLYERATLLSARYVGGAYTSRDHRGQAGGEPPFRAIPRSVQERAFGLLAKNVFGRDALVFPPGLLADLAASREPPFAGGLSPRLDFPITQVVAGLQDQVTDALFAPGNLRRIVDTALKVGDPSQTISLADLFGWMQAAVFDELAPPAPSAGDALHRSLQRRYLNLLAAIALAPPGVLDRLGYPIESVVLARYELTALAPRLDQALARHDLDDAVRAHLEYLRTRVRQALAAQSIQG